MKNYYVYMMSNKKAGVIYIGITSDLIRRTYEHKNKVVEGFSKKYNLNMLVYYEVYDEVVYAIKREKRLKKYRREAKIELIEKDNPCWNDLYKEIVIA